MCGITQEPFEEVVAKFAIVAADGSTLGIQMMDQTAGPVRGSPIWTLDALRAAVPPTAWLDSDIMLLAKTLRVYVGIAALHLGGLSRILRAGPPIDLHPLVSLVRSIAEATGKAWWQVEPWLDDEGAAETLQPEEWELRSRPILARLELTHLDEL